MLPTLLLLSVSAPFTWCLGPGSKQTMVDLTYSFDKDTIYWPTTIPFQLKERYRGPMRDFWFEVNDYSGNEHGGTHMDAPSHFYKDNWPIGDIPIERFIAPAVVIDISARASTNSDAQLLVQDILDWEDNHGTIPAGAVVFMYSAWGAKWPDKVAYYNSSTYNDTSTIHFPGIHPDATQWLVDNRDIVGLGVDTMSIDYAQSSDYMTHRIAYKQNIYGLEGVANLNLLPPAGATIYAMPMKIGLGSAAPCRIIATLPDSMSNTGIRMNCKHHFLAALLIIAQILVYLN